MRYLSIVFNHTLLYRLIRRTILSPTYPILPSTKQYLHTVQLRHNMADSPSNTESKSNHHDNIANGVDSISIDKTRVHHIPTEADRQANKLAKQAKNNANKSNNNKTAKSNAPKYVVDKNKANTPYVLTRLHTAESIEKSLHETYQNKSSAKQSITITLPGGATKPGVAYDSTPYSIAHSISPSLAKNAIIAKVNDELYDMNRVLENDCTLEIITKVNDDADIQHVFWHSSAHVLGQALEIEYSEYEPQLTIGPALADGGFYYDVYFGKPGVDGKPFTISHDDYQRIESRCLAIINNKQSYTRLVLDKQQALDMFSENIFKQYIINTKVPDGHTCTAYHSGDLVDLCRGPHIANTQLIKSIHIYNHGSAYWLGDANNQSVQRVYGISFDSESKMQEWKQLRAAAINNDHRKIGNEQKLFFFHEYSPGSPFFLPHGARIYNTLINFIKAEYWKRGYNEVMTPNVFSTELWKTSGHYANYKENMFLVEVEKQEYGMKPMNVCNTIQQPVTI